MGRRSRRSGCCARSAPRPPMGLNDAAWQLIAHLTPNYAALVMADGDPAPLREHLALYARADDPVLRRAIDGVVRVTGAPITRRVRGRTGWRSRAGCGSMSNWTMRRFENGGMFLFAAVVERFLAEFTTINSFTETHFRSAREGVFTRFPLRTGRKPLL
ncbi:type VI secretion system baseplate subunit TssF [Sphingomonas sp. MMS24-JH45]